MSNDEMREEWEQEFINYTISTSGFGCEQTWLAACEYQQEKIDKLLKLFDGKPTHWSNVIYDKNKEIEKLEKENAVMKEALSHYADTLLHPDSYCETAKEALEKIEGEK